MQFVIGKQNEDGGWGESYLSCVTRKYSTNKQEGCVPLPKAVFVLCVPVCMGTRGFSPSARCPVTVASLVVAAGAKS